MNAKRKHRQDLDLASRAAGGDQSAWREIYDASSDSLFNFLCYQTGDREAAKDLLQETFVTAMKAVENFRGDGSLHGWLRSIALHKTLDWRRSLARRARKHLGFIAEAPSETDLGPEPSFRSEQDALQEAINSISPKQRAAMLLRELEGLSFKELGEELGCAEATARVHYHRAGEVLRKKLEGSEYGELADGTEGMRS